MYMEDEKNIGEFQQRILLTHADRLRGNLDHMESEWENLRDGIPQANYNRMKIIVEESMSAVKATLWRAELFMCHAAQQSMSMERGPKLEDARSLTSPDLSQLGTA